MFVFLLFFFFRFYGITSKITWSNKDLPYQWHLDVVFITSPHHYSTFSGLRFSLTSTLFSAYRSFGWWKLLAIEPRGNKVNVLSSLNNDTKFIMTIFASIFLVNTSEGGDSSLSLPKNFNFICRLKHLFTKIVLVIHHQLD